MREILFIVIVCFYNTSFSQNLFPIKDGDIEISEVINTNVNKNNAFLNLQEWISKYYSHLDYKKIIQVEDSIAGKIIFKGNKSADKEIKDKGKTIWINMSYTVYIDIKDNKFKITVRDVKANLTSFEFSLFDDMLNSNDGENPLVHLKKIDLYKSKIQYIKDKNKKLKNKHLKDIEHYKQEIHTQQELYNTEYDVIFDMIENIKENISNKTTTHTPIN